MRYVKGHGLETRNRIVEEASLGLRQAGVDGMSVADLMKLVGLTHGGFYSYFESREALVIEAFAAAMDRTMSQWRNLMKGMPAEEQFDAFVEAYLTPGHRDDRARGCVLPALGTDIARSSQKARRAFARKLDEMIDVIAALFPGRTPEKARQIATSALATMMGSIALARAVGDKKLSDEILGAGRQALGGRATGRRAPVVSEIRRANKNCKETIMTEHVKTEIDAGIMTLTLARADKKNALSNAMYSAMSDGLERAEKDPAVRVVLFQGDGDSFTAGNDLADFSAQANGKDTGEPQAHRFISNLGKATRPLVAAVQGNAVGVGTTMLLHCDLVFLADTAKLMTPFVNLALVPEAASSWLLPARIGHVRAYAMFALGEPLDAATALACGLANAVVPAAELRARARAAAEALTKRPAGSLNHTKALMRDMDRIAAQISREGALFRQRLQTGEAREAFAAFAERRKPDFSKFAG